MSEQSKINIKHLHTLVLQESENDSIQKLDSNLYNLISELIKNLKTDESDVIKTKLSQAMINMVSDTTSILLKLRLEKAMSEDSNRSVLLDEEKYVLGSRAEMTERKAAIISGILSGKPHNLDG